MHREEPKAVELEKEHQKDEHPRTVVNWKFVPYNPYVYNPEGVRKSFDAMRKQSQYKVS